MSNHGGRQTCADSSGRSSGYGHAARLTAARPLPPDARGTAADAITAAGGTVAVHSKHEPLVRILLDAADQLRTDGPAGPVGARILLAAVVEAALRHGDLRREVSDAQTDACYALLTAACGGVSPLMWAERPGSTRAAAVTALTTAARKAAAA